jgi:hypothetical protein
MAALCCTPVIGPYVSIYMVIESEREFDYSKVKSYDSAFEVLVWEAAQIKSRGNQIEISAFVQKINGKQKEYKDMFLPHFQKNLQYRAYGTFSSLATGIAILAAKVILTVFTPGVLVFAGVYFAYAILLGRGYYQNSQAIELVERAGRQIILSSVA